MITKMVGVGWHCVPEQLGLKGLNTYSRKTVNPHTQFLICFKLVLYSVHDFGTWELSGYKREYIDFCFSPIYDGRVMTAVCHMCYDSNMSLTYYHINHLMCY